MLLASWSRVPEHDSTVHVVFKLERTAAPPTFVQSFIIIALTFASMQACVPRFAIFVLTHACSRLPRVPVHPGHQLLLASLFDDGWSSVLSHLSHLLLILLTPVQSIDVFNLFSRTYPRRVDAASRNAANAIRMKMETSFFTTHESSSAVLEQCLWWLLDQAAHFSKWTYRASLKDLETGAEEDLGRFGWTTNNRGLSAWR